MSTRLFLAKCLLTLLVACGTPAQLPPDSVPVDDLNGDAVVVSAPTTKAVEGALASSVPLLVQSLDDRERLTLHPIDTLTGRDVIAYEPIELGRGLSWAFSPNGKILAVLVERSRGGQLLLIDLQTWLVTEMNIAVNSNVWLNPSTGPLTFNADGSRLAITYDALRIDYLAVVDVHKYSIIAQIPVAFKPHSARFMADDKSLAVFGSITQMDDELPLAVLYNVRDLHVDWEVTLPDIAFGVHFGGDWSGPDENVVWNPAVVFSPTRDALHIVHADEDRLTTIDFAQQLIHTLEIQPVQSMLEQWLSLGAGVAHASVWKGATKQAVLSNDAQRLYVIGWRNDVTGEAHDWHFDQTSFGLRVIDVSSGSEIARADMQAQEIKLSPDGSKLYLYHEFWSEVDESQRGWTDIVDANRLELVTRLDGQRIVPTRLLNGQTILSSTHDQNDDSTQFAVMDAQSLEIIQTFSLDSYAMWLTLP